MAWVARTFIVNYPAYFSKITALNVETGQLNFLLFLPRVVYKIILVATTLLFVMDRGLEQELFSKSHDLLHFCIFFLLEVFMVANIKQISALVQDVAELLEDLQSDPVYSKHAEEYQRDTLRCGISATVHYISGSTIWAAASYWYRLHYESMDTKYFHILVGWIPSPTGVSERKLLFALAYAFSVVTFLDFFIMYCWFLTMAFCALKIKLKIRVLCTHIGRIDESVNHSTERVLDKVEADRNLLYCNECLVKMYGSRAVSVWARPLWLGEPSVLEDSRCCKNAIRETMQQIFLKRYWKKLVDQHNDIIELVHLVEKTFKYSILVFAQFAVLLAVMPVPALGSGKATTAEYVHVGLEAVGVLLFNAVISWCGQIVLDHVIDQLFTH